MASLNAAAPQSQGRRPKGKILFGGAAIPGWESITADLNAHNSSASWEAEFPLYSLPPQNGIAWWSQQTDLDVEIQFANDVSAAPVSIFYGMLDDVEFDFARGTLGLKGRDYSGIFVDSIVTKNYQQQTSSAIAKAICANHPELTPQITSTSTPAGRYYNNVGSRLSRDESEWDFLTRLAQAEGFVVLVRGKTLYFGPPPVPDASSPYLLNFVPPIDDQQVKGNVKTLNCKRSLTIARDIAVVVQSFNRQTGKTLKATANVKNSSRSGKSGSKVSQQVYTFNIPSLTQQQAQAEANARAQELSRHERSIDATSYGDTALGVSTVLKLQGTGSDFDQLYYPDSVSHHMSATVGYEMTISAKNNSPYVTISQ